MQSLEKRYPLQLGKNNPILRTVAEPVSAISEEIKQFAVDLQKLLRLYEGVGLAAPQVGKSVRMIASTQRKNAKRGDELIAEVLMINPEIVEASDTLWRSEEACLSLPGESGIVNRYKKITVRYLGIDGKIYTQTLSDFNAAIVQHEIDHLDGILFIDKLSVR